MYFKNLPGRLSTRCVFISLEALTVNPIYQTRSIKLSLQKARLLNTFLLPITILIMLSLWPIIVTFIFYMEKSWLSSFYYQWGNSLINTFLTYFKYTYFFTTYLIKKWKKIIVAYAGHTNEVKFLINGDLFKFARYKHTESINTTVWS